MEWRSARGIRDTDQQGDSLAKAELFRRVTAAKRSELALAAERGLKDLDLSERIRAARTNDDLVGISKEVGALLGQGALSPARGRAIQALMAEARHNMREHREAEGNEDPDTLILVTHEGGRLLRAFEGIVSDERRARLIALAEDEARADLAEHPNVDLARDSSVGSEPSHPESQPSS